MTIFVSLGSELRDLAEQVGRQRQAENRAAEQYDGRVLSDPLDPDLQGAWAELAVAAVFDLPWTGKFVTHEQWKLWRITEDADVGDNIQVRSTLHRDGKLLLHPSDRDDVPYVLVRLDIGNNIASIRGWIDGYEGKKRGEWLDVGYGRPCFYVSARDLYNIRTLPGIPSGLDFRKLVTQVNRL